MELVNINKLLDTIKYIGYYNFGPTKVKPSKKESGIKYLNVSTHTC